MEGFGSLGRKAMATQQKMFSGLHISTIWTHKIYNVIETMTKLMLTKMAKLQFQAW